MIAGFQHGEDEPAPFTSPTRKFLRTSLEKMKVGMGLVMLTNVVKVHRPPLGMGADAAEAWVNLFDTEVEILSPRCVVLCGLTAALWVLDLPHGNLEKLRFTRFVKESRQAVSYFVTYAPEDIRQPPAGLSPEGLEFTQDLRAVFEADGRYFDRIKILKNG